jgi:hypothetical protein
MFCCPSQPISRWLYRHAARRHMAEALFAVGAAALLLLFIGIHNAWDAVTYHMFVKKQGEPEGDAHR